MQLSKRKPKLGSLREEQRPTKKSSKERMRKTGDQLGVGRKEKRGDMSLLVVQPGCRTGSDCPKGFALRDDRKQSVRQVRGHVDECDKPLTLGEHEEVQKEVEMVALLENDEELTPLEKQTRLQSRAWEAATH